MACIEKSLARTNCVLMRFSLQNDTVTDGIQKIAESYKCKPIEGMLSHQLKQHVIDGEKAIIQNPTELQR